MTSYPFFHHIPFAMLYADGAPIYITTNIDNDASGSMADMNKLFGILAKQGLVDFVGSEELFNVAQNIWKLNTDVYTSVRRGLK